MAQVVLATNVFDQGKYSVKSIKVEKSEAPSFPPESLLIFTPTVEGTYSVLLFLNGFQIENTKYKQLLQHISSHGFIVVAPQLSSFNPFKPFSGTEDINSAAAVTNWLATGLQSKLPDDVKPNLHKLAVSGHSRGGYIAFALALGNSPATLKFSALLGLDPVAGTHITGQLDPKILTDVPHSFKLGVPVAVIGTGIGRACTPIGMNHNQFFTECKPPCSYFYAKDYGHVDMLDDPGVLSKVCESGKGDKEPFKKCLGGVFVAFLRAYLEGKSEDLKAIVDEPSIAPVTLDPVIYVRSWLKSNL